jgi:hypothetical protein
MTEYRIVKDGGAYYIEYRSWITLWRWSQQHYDHQTYESARKELDAQLSYKGKEVLYKTN